MSQSPAANDVAARNAVVLVVDGLSAAMLGAYGNTWFETANLNRLASQSLLFDFAFASSTNLKESYRRFWNPDKRFDQKTGGQNREGLIDSIAKLGATTCLLTDEPVLADLNLTDSFDHVAQIDSPVVNEIASDVGQTELANFFAQAASWLADLEPGSLAWIHSRGLTGAWDAPHAMRAGLVGEGDPVPGTFYQPPKGRFDLEQDDPDDLLGFQQAAAAQVMLLDQFLGILLDLMESDPFWQSTLLCFTSTRGYPLGEHGILGHNHVQGDEILSNYNESVHVPMMISAPNTAEFNDFRSLRNRSLRQTDLINECLIDWFADDPSQFVGRIQSLAFGAPELCDQAIVIKSEGGESCSVSIQTHAWKLIKSFGNDDAQSNDVELYAKPDDRWEVNDVSRRCPQIVESLSRILDQWLKEGALSGSGGLGLGEALWTRAN